MWRLSIPFILLAFGFGHATEESGDNEWRTSTFLWRGTMHQQRDRAHLGTKLSLDTSIRSYHKLRKAFLHAEEQSKKEVEKRRKAHRSSEINALGGVYTYEQLNNILRASLARVYDRVSFVCHVTNCRTPIDPIDPPYDTATVEQNHIKLSGGTASAFPTREKRQLFGAVLGGVALGLSIYNQVEITQLQEDVFTLQKNQDKIFAVLEDHQAAIERNRETLIKLVNFIHDQGEWMRATANRMSLDEFFALFNAFVTEQTDWLDQLERVLFDKKPSPRFFHQRIINEAIHKLGEAAEKKDLELAYTHFNEILDSPLSFIVKDSLIYIMVHIPLVDKKSYSLYSLIDAPVRVPTGQTARLTERRRMLATDRGNSEFITMTEEEFSQCELYQGRYCCMLGVTSKTADSSCVGAIFMHSTMAPHICDFHFTTESSESVTQVAADAVIVTASSYKSTVVTRLNCFSTAGRSTSEESVVRGAARVRVPAGCVLSTENFAFRPAVYSGLHEDFAVRPLYEPALLDVLQSTSLQAQLPTLNVTEEDLPPLPELPHLDHITRHVGLLQSAVVIVGALLFCLFVLVVLIYICKKRRANSRRKKEKRSYLSYRDLLAKEAPIEV